MPGERSKRCEGAGGCAGRERAGNREGSGQVTGKGAGGYPERERAGIREGSERVTKGGSGRVTGKGAGNRKGASAHQAGGGSGRVSGKGARTESTCPEKERAHTRNGEGRVSKKGKGAHPEREKNRARKRTGTGLMGVPTTAPPRNNGGWHAISAERRGAGSGCQNQDARHQKEC